MEGVLSMGLTPSIYIVFSNMREIYMNLDTLVSQVLVKHIPQKSESSPSTASVQLCKSFTPYTASFSFIKRPNDFTNIYGNTISGSFLFQTYLYGTASGSETAQKHKLGDKTELILFCVVNSLDLTEKSQSA